MRLADVNLARSVFPRAIETLREVLRLEPDEGEALYKLGVALLALGERDAARQAWSRLVEHGASTDTRADYVEKARRALNRLPVARRPNRGILINPPPAPPAGIDIQAFLMMNRRKTGAAFLN
jgi:tetratricopeptide (TPR) repeat protein